MQISGILALASFLSTVLAQYKGFNYGSTFTTGAAKAQSDFENEFNLAQGLTGAPGFTSARLYTMIQAGSANTPIAAIPAAISTQTTLLLGLWASAGQDSFNDELAALSSAISQYGSSFTDLIAGISVGSEDLYRISPTGIENLSGVGAGPDVITNYISQVRDTITNTGAASKPVGHVDTWTAWVNGSNSAVVQACDFIGMDAYPYFQTTLANSIDNGNSTFFDAYDATIGAAAGKPVWVTETGWPVSGPTENQAVASIANAKTYWDEVGCSLFDNTNIWWYTVQDAEPDTPSPSFGIVGSGSTTPLFDLTCPAGTSSAPSSSASSSHSVASSSVASATPASSVTATASNPASTVTPIPGPGLDTTTAQGSVSSASIEPIPSQSLASATASASIQSSTFITSAKSAPAATESGTPAPAPTSTAASPSSTACPANLDGTYEYPHLIVPVNSSQPTEAYGMSYDGQISNTVSSLFNFDIPASDVGKTCTLVFLFPTKDQLKTSDFTLSGSGDISVVALDSPATEQTTYATCPAGSTIGSVASVAPGNSYTIWTGACPAGDSVGYELSATGDLSLEYFQDSDPSPIGLYITIC